MSKFKKKGKRFHPYRPPRNYDNIMVTHGYKTHTLKEAKDCAYCQKVIGEFKKHGY